MYAVEFLAKIINGTIEIPEAYRDRLRQRVRVILLSDETDNNTELGTSILDVLEQAPGQRAFNTAAEVDQYLQEERQAWDR